VYDASFQLSFLATLGLLTLGKKLELFLKFIPNNFELRSILSATLATQVFVAPFLVYMMGEISVISPLVNMLILIFIPFTMFFGLVLVLLSFLSNSLALFVSFFVFILLYYDLKVVNYFAELDFSVLKININFREMMIIYLVFILVYIFYKSDIITKIIKNK